jgi:hypothetical protein
LENPSDLCVQVCDREEHSHDLSALDQPNRLHLTIVAAEGLVVQDPISDQPE